MRLKDKLLAETQEAIRNRALEFAIKVEPELIKLAQQGKSEMLLSLDKDEYKEIVKSPLFIDTAEDLLDGVKLEITISNSSGLFKIPKEVLRVSWGDVHD